MEDTELGLVWFRFALNLFDWFVFGQVDSQVELSEASVLLLDLGANYLQISNYLHNMMEDTGPCLVWFGLDRFPVFVGQLDSQVELS